MGLEYGATTYPQAIREIQITILQTFVVLNLTVRIYNTSLNYCYSLTFLYLRIYLKYIPVATNT